MCGAYDAVPQAWLLGPIYFILLMFLLFVWLQKGDTLFHPILLQEVTVFEMMKIIAEIFEVPVQYILLLS